MLPRLVIRRELGYLSIESKAAQLTPSQRRMQMSTNFQPSSFTGGGRLPKVQIDQTEAFASAGLKPILRMANDASKKALQQGIQAIEQITSEGLQFLRIENHTNPVPSIARQNMEARHQADLTITSMPSVGPQISVAEGNVSLNWSPSSLNIQWEHISVGEGNFTPGEINISWMQRPSIEISLEPGTEFILPVNTAVGNNLDAAT